MSSADAGPPTWRWAIRPRFTSEHYLFLQRLAAGQAQVGELLGAKQQADNRKSTASEEAGEHAGQDDHRKLVRSTTHRARCSCSAATRVCRSCTIAAPSICAGGGRVSAWKLNYTARPLRTTGPGQLKELRAPRWRGCEPQSSTSELGHDGEAVTHATKLAALTGGEQVQVGAAPSARCSRGELPCEELQALRDLAPRRDGQGSPPTPRRAAYQDNDHRGNRCAWGW